MVTSNLSSNHEFYEFAPSVDIHLVLDGGSECHLYPCPFLLQSDQQHPPPFFFISNVIQPKIPSKTQNASLFSILFLWLLLFCSLPNSLEHRQWLSDPTLRALPCSSTHSSAHLRLIPSCYCCEVCMWGWWGWGGDWDWMRRWVVKPLRSCWSKLQEIGEFGEQQQEEVQQP